MLKLKIAFRKMERQVRLIDEEKHPLYRNTTENEIYVIKSYG